MRAQLQYLNGRTHRVLPLSDTVTVGGRASPIQVEGATVTRQHARIFEEGGRFWIEALEGESVMVNGTEIQRAQLTNRDKIQIGSLRLEYFED
jgi:pSer/pThr/pTyr-binding forkhead associated (FHA) protein